MTKKSPEELINEFLECRKYDRIGWERIGLVGVGEDWRGLERIRMAIDGVNKMYDRMGNSCENFQGKERVK